ncbi:hypothetical protein [Nocardioides sp. CER19]|uniref:hypothetical protein n=1 Tax=Nocardioides sp. CER19 TaxID=3038538 RepID=UPI00244C0E98|nr:hypothetical protein [Nocardioides sp. CER19]MDH2414581.1 hypothetical protein [Nocardioides sp. CER19]
MVEGFDYPEGEPGPLKSAAATLGTIHTDLGTHGTTIAGGVDDASSTWRGPRKKDFVDAGTGILGALDGAGAVLQGAQEQLAGYAQRLARARTDIDDLRVQAERHLGDVADLPDGDPATATARSRAAGAVSRLREHAEEIRDRIKRDAGATAAALDSATGLIVPGAVRLTPDQVARRVHAQSDLGSARAALVGGALTADAAWDALSGLVKAGASLGEKFVSEWGGFKPPGEGGPIATTLYALGQAQFAASSVTGWMADQRFSHFRPINAAGQTIPKAGLGFWERLKYGAGRFPTRQGLNPLERLTGFDPKGHFSARPWKGGAAEGWGTAGKWLSRGGTVLTFATSAWGEWEQDAKYPTDERAGRAATVGATTAAGAWAGAEVGAWAGGAIGTAICPGVGTVIGAGIGGLVGGFVGSEAGQWVGDQLKDLGGEAGHAISEGVGAAGDAIGGAAHAVGDFVGGLF